MPRTPRRVDLVERRDHWCCRFVAMGSPCELLVADTDRSLAQDLGDVVAAEAWRIEDRFSRYLPGNIVDRINRSEGRSIEVDAETAGLLDFCQTLFELSEGRFDISSGVLREAWTFDGSDRLPAPERVEGILQRVGWQRVTWRRPSLTLAPGMQIDFGGVGKEYAVDRAAVLVAAGSTPCLVNFGGDLAAVGAPSIGWQVGIEIPAASSGPTETARLSVRGNRIRLHQGALATSGDSRRFLEHDGIRYSHILDPTTGWPVTHAPRSVTVAADTCTQAGMLATLAMLRGAEAESFLDGESVQYWLYR